MGLTRRSFLGKSALTVLSLSLPSVASAESDPIMSILERYVRFQEPEWNSRNLDLQTKLDEFFQSYWLKGSVNDGEVQSYLLFDANKNRTMAALNDNLQMWAASTVKVYHNLLFFDALSKGQASYNISDKKRLGDLFHADWKGSNHAANEILDLIGGEELANDLLRTYGFNQSHIEYIPESGRTPGSQTSARDLTNFWRKTFNKELPYSDQMLQYLIARSHPMLSSDNLFYDSQFEVYGTGGKNYGARSGTLAIEEQDGTTYFLTMLIQDKSAKETNFLGNYRLWKEIKTQEIRQPTEWFVNTHIKSKYNLNNHRSSLTECR